jgi:TPP-dependent pyruvate/acetoin dehydrogenase alpha subunit
VASEPIKIPEGGRRSSGGSVKDLVHSFEEMDRSREIEERALQLRRQKSAGRLAAGTTTKTTNGKPAWR